MNAAATQRTVFWRMTKGFTIHIWTVNWFLWWYFSRQFFQQSTEYVLCVYTNIMVCYSRLQLFATTDLAYSIFVAAALLLHLSCARLPGLSCRLSKNLMSNFLTIFSTILLFLFLGFHNFSPISLKFCLNK